MTEKINGENKEKQPTVSLEFLFGSHLTADDAKKLKEKIDESDVFVPEMGGWPEGLDTVLQTIADGTISPSYYDKLIDAQIREGKHFEEEELRLLLNCKKKILLVDIPQGSEFTSLLEARTQKRRAAMDAFISGSYDLYESLLKQSFDIDARIENFREQYIQKRFAEELPSLLYRYPDLKRKDAIKVFVFLGSFHTQVYHEVKSHNPDVDVRRSISNMVHPLQSEILRRYMRHMPVDEVLYARYFIAQALTNYTIRAVSNDSVQVAAVIRFVVSKLSLEDIKEISKQMGIHESGSKKMEVFFNEVSQRTKLPLPTNRQGFEELSLAVQKKTGRDFANRVK